MGGTRPGEVRLRRGAGVQRSPRPNTAVRPRSGAQTEEPKAEAMASASSGNGLEKGLGI